ncbi:MAG: acetyl-transferase [Gemmatimonadetes bacterium]|nr:acetyl-transferase [Gemmatimonadota bacterium]
MLTDYARVPIAFEMPVSSGVSTTKDYDAIPGNGPLDWPTRFDVSDWVFFTARAHGRCIGGAVAIFRSNDFDMLDGRDDLALLWDIRVSPDVRAQGVGAALLAAVESAMRRRGARTLKVETQDVNAGACRFYQRHGFALERAAIGAYPEFPDEVQLLWYKTLTEAPA